MGARLSRSCLALASFTGFAAIAGCSAVLGIHDISPPEPDAASGDSGVAADASPESMQDATGRESGDAPSEIAEAAPPDALGEAASDGGCGDTTSSPANCGRCGHGCLGATCTNSRCDPTILAQGFSVPVGIAVQGTTVYLAHGQAIWYCDVTGCGGNLKLQSALPGSELPTSMVQMGTKLYFPTRWYATDGGNTGSIQFSDESVVGVPPSTLASTPSLATQITACGNSVCWADGPSGFAQTVYSCSTTAGCTTPTTVVPGPTGTNALASDGTTLYIAASNGIESCPLAGCGAPTTLVANQPNTTAIVYSNGQLFWSTNQNTVMKCTLPNCPSTATPLATGAGWPYAIAVDSTTVYWVDYGDPGSVLKCDIAGCNGTPTVLADSQPKPAGIAVDAARVYWYVVGTTGPSGALAWVAK